MKKSSMLILAAWCAAAFTFADTLQVVATLPDYGVISKTIGGGRVHVQTIVHGDQDAHFIRPKPSFVTMVKNADVLVSTGLDLELWLPTVIDKSGNTLVRSGQKGFIKCAEHIPLLEIPKTISRAEGGVHIYGNPHLTCSPLNIRDAARNIAEGFTRNDPKGKELFEKNLEQFLAGIDRRLFGEELIRLLGAKTLCAMARNNTLYPFLKKHNYGGKPLTAYLGGWLKKMEPLRGKEIVTYHKNWVYFLKLFGMKESGTIEPKPGIPPSAKHVAALVEMMRAKEIKLLLAANYFDHQKVKSVASKVGAAPVIVPIYVNGAPGTEDYFKLVDRWTDKLLEAAREKNVVN